MMELIIEHMGGYNVRLHSWTIRLSLTTDAQNYMFSTASWVGQFKYAIIDIAYKTRLWCIRCNLTRCYLC